MRRAMQCTYSETQGEYFEARSVSHSTLPRLKERSWRQEVCRRKTQHGMTVERQRVVVEDESDDSPRHGIVHCLDESCYTGTKRRSDRIRAEEWTCYSSDNV
ncbi:hypothetical protein DOTSEDRAFT_71476 [Dothistroma septosporum NZE10]|uniref:Uncharacterized protein n=1 Tax=Dothistroma septosporum (strain NZE10 / CBS 128990) TaxID=675120 RepID=N1PTW2_DOTSN|nr:hypothetical protein DOTSEDRAFT_71476 [Dothistroma septosporum NZE10]